MKTYTYSMCGLVEWLEDQRPQERYDYMCASHCLHARFRRACGRGYNPLHIAAAWLWPIGLTGKIERLAHRGQWTFGAALERARAAL